MQTEPKFNGFAHLLECETLQTSETIFWTPSPRFSYLENVQISRETEPIFWHPSLRFCYQDLKLKPVAENIFWQI